MEDTRKKTLRNKLIAVIGLAAVIICAWQVIVLKLLEKGTIKTITAMVLLLGGIISVLLFVGAIVKFFYDMFMQILSGVESVGNTSIKKKAGKMLERNDEVGEMLRNVESSVHSFAGIVNGIRKASADLKEVSESFQEIFHSMTSAVEESGREIESITNNTIEQADRTVDMKEKIEAISNSIGKIADNVETLAKSAELMKEYDTSAERLMKELVDISEKSSHAMEAVRKQTELTNESVQQIRSATEIIAGISSQTNLLALNASIEAARAGEYGKGFAVVAEEIRTLADQSKGSTETIGQVVTNLIDNAQISVEVTKEVSEAFLKQNEKIQDTEEIFSSLNQEIATVSGSIKEIAGEVEGLDRHRGIIETGVVSLTSSAEKNADSARITTNNMEEFRQIVEECNETTAAVVNVAEELFGYLKEFEVDSMKEKMKL